MRQQKANIKYMFKKRNQMVDYLANLSINKTKMQQFRNFEELPNKDKCIQNTNKSQIPSIRIRIKEIKTHAKSESRI